MGQATFSGNGAYKIDVDATLVSQSGLTSTIYWRVIVVKNGSSGHAAWGNNGSSGWADSSQGINNDLWSNGNIQFNFMNGSSTGSFTMAEGTFQVAHRPDGNAEYYVNGGLTLTGIGTASSGTGWRSLPRIHTSTIPNAPTPTGFSNITQTEIRYKFTGNGDGGSAVLEWQVQYGPDPSTPWWTASSNGNTTMVALQPGKTYYFWARGRNANGWGPLSARTSARTIAGARVKHGGTWKEAVPYVKVNGVWRLAQPHVKVNGTWRKTS